MDKLLEYIKSGQWEKDLAKTAGIDNDVKLSEEEISKYKKNPSLLLKRIEELEKSIKEFMERK